MTHREIVLRDKLLRGMRMACTQLIATKEKEDADFVLSIDGEIVVVKGSNIKEVIETRKMVLHQ